MEPFHINREDGIGFSIENTGTFYKKILKTDAALIPHKSTTRFVFALGFHPSGSMLPKRWTQHSRKPNIPKRAYISQRAFQTFVKEYNQYILSFYKDLKAQEVQFSVACCCPLPVGYYTGEVADIFAKDEMAEWHHDYQTAFARELELLGISYHMPPDEVFEADRRYMKQMYAADRKVGDYHANPVYGQLMLKNILSDLSM